MAKGERVGRYGNKRVASASALAFQGGKVCPVSERASLAEKENKTRIQGNIYLKKKEESRNKANRLS